MHSADGPTIVDLFSGCGGLSLGASFAGYRSLAAVEIEPTLQSAYRRNFPRSQAIEASVTDIADGDWRHLIGRARPDGVIGGPPCQGFSWIGKRIADDPRNSLLFHFYRHVAALRPKFFLMENVEGILHESAVPLLNEAISTLPPSYKVLAPISVVASHYGAATSRRRIIVVGYDPSEMDAISPTTFSPAEMTTLATVKDAIADLPNPTPETKGDPDTDWAMYPTRAAKNLSPYALQLRRLAPDGLGSKEHNERHAAGLVSGVTSTRHSREIVRRYAGVPSGRCDPITKSYKLEWGGQCPTLRAGTGSERGAFQAVRPLHPSKGRVITVREAARMQGFPDWFSFHPTKWHSFRMIGNSVSPFVSEGLLSRIIPHMHVRLAA